MNILSKIGKLYRNLISKFTEAPPIQGRERNKLLKYWSDPWDGSNLATHYAKTEGGKLEVSRHKRSVFLEKLIKRYSTSKDNILEIGCNVGRNLSTLFSSRFRNLSGIEISKKALDLMKIQYPKMAKSSRIYNKPVEKVIKDFKDEEFDIVYTMAVLQHIHTDSEFIFREMFRITRKFIITIEDEKQESWRHFPRNYKKIFESFGMKQVEKRVCDFDLEGLNRNFVARVFKKYE